MYTATKWFIEKLKKLIIITAGSNGAGNQIVHKAYVTNQHTKNEDGVNEIKLSLLLLCALMQKTFNHAKNKDKYIS